MKLSEIKDLVQGLEVYREGEFNGLGLAVARAPISLLTFIEKEEYLSGLSESVKCIICNKDVASKVKSKYGVIISEKPRISYFTLHNIFTSQKTFKKEEFKTVVGKNCSIASSAIIREKNIIIGNNVTIEDFVVIEEGTIIKDNSVIRSGCKIGGVGFEFKRYESGMMDVLHAGGVIIEENVEIQYNTCIDRGLYHWDNTIIGNYSKIDNLVYIAHGVKIGNQCLIAANATIGGRTVLGNNCWVGLGATIANGLRIGNDCRINMAAAVTKDVNDNESMSGNFAIEHSKFIRFIKKLRDQI